MRAFHLRTKVAGRVARRARAASEGLENRILLSSISGRAWDDVDGDRIFDTGEASLSGWSVYLDQNRNATRDSAETVTTTDITGNYTITSLSAGTYFVALETPAGWEQTFPNPSPAAVAEPDAIGKAALTSTGSDAEIFPSAGGATVRSPEGERPAWGRTDGVGVTPSTAQSSPLIRLTQVRGDARFAGIDGRGMAVAIIDTGIDLDHPAFGPDADGDGVADRIVYHYDFANDDADGSDVHGHGSNVASIAAGSEPSYLGMAPAADIVALKVFQNGGYGEFSYMERALQWVVANASAYNIAAVNMSIGDNLNHNSETALYGLGDELAALAAQNVIVVSAAGNDYYLVQAQGVAYPASDPNSLAVGAVYDANVGQMSYTNGAIDFTTAPDRVVSFSQRSTTVMDVLAPGAIITGADDDGGTWNLTGTSQASPHVAGMAVLAQQLAMRQLGRRLTPGEFRSLLRDNAASVFDGDDENDNVTNSNASYKRLDAFGLSQAIYDLGGNYLAGAHVVTLGASENRTGIDFGARQLPLLPGRPNLVHASDTGISETDDLTNLDNSSAAKRIQFAVPNTMPGTTVEIYADGVLIGTGTAPVGRSTVVTTGGTLDLADGSHTITARLVGDGRAPSPMSPGLMVNVDTVLPANPTAFDLRASSDTGISSTDNLTLDPTPTFDLSVAAGDWFRVTRNGAPISGDYETGNRYTAAAQADGQHAFRLVAADAAGNVSGGFVEQPVTIDTRGWVPQPAYDTSFGNGGIASALPVGDHIQDVALQSDGKTVVAGFVYTDNMFDASFVVARVNIGGTLDTTFGNGGIVRLNTAYEDKLYAVVVQPDGKILAGGRVSPGDSSLWRPRFALWRLNPNGTPDASFGVNGLVTHLIGDGQSTVMDLAVLPDGKILAGGEGVRSSHFGHTVGRYLPNGAVDTTFGTNGMAFVRNYDHDFGTAMTVAPGGKIVMAGYGYPPVVEGDGWNVAVSRFTAGGQPDATFSDDGTTSIRLGPYGGTFAGVAVQPDGKVVAVGEAGLTSGSPAAYNVVARFNTDGSLDGGFGDEGISTARFTSNFERLSDVAIQPDGRIVASGGPIVGGLLVARYRPDGHPDGTFGTGGATVTTAFAEGYGLARRPDGRIVVAGGTQLTQHLPSMPPQPMTLDPSSDTGPSDSDRITSDTTPTFNVPVAAGFLFRVYRNGALVDGSYVSGTNYTAPPQPYGAASWTFAGIDPAGNETMQSPPVVVTISDPAAQPVTFRASADAHVRDGTYAGQNFGTNSELHVKRSTFAGSSREIFLKFNLAGVASVAAAKLRLFGRIDSSSETPQVGVFPVSNTSWGESTITWNNRPATGATALSTQTVATNLSKWYEWDVTSYLAAEKAAGRNVVTLALRALQTSSPYLIFASDEATANRPELVVTPNPSTPTQSLVVSSTNLAVPEGATATATVHLAAQPTSNVTVNVTRQSGDTDISAAPSTLVFTSATWSVPQTVTWAAAHDADTANGVATFAVSSTGLTPVSVTATEQDDDTPAAPFAVQPIADSFVRDGSYSGQNFGLSTELQLKKGGSGSNREIYFKFDVSVAGADLASAKLRVLGLIHHATQAPSVALYAATNTGWSETGLTWNNRPATGATALATTTVATNVAKYYEWDVTNFLRAERAAGRTQVTLVLKSLTTTDPYLIFNSDEAALSQPELMITPGTGAPVQNILRAGADTFVRDGPTYAGQNFGTSAQLQLKNAGVGWYRESYLRFDLSQLTTVSSGKLRLFGRLDNTASPAEAFQVLTSSNTTWGESSVTWNARLPSDNVVHGAATVTGTAGKWYEVDLTPLIQERKAAGATALTLVLREARTSNSTIVFDSDEGTNRPELVVVS